MPQQFRASRTLRGLASGCGTTDGLGNLGLFGFAVSALGEFTVCEQLMQGSALGVQLTGRRAGGRLGKEAWKGGNPPLSWRFPGLL